MSVPRPILPAELVEAASRCCVEIHGDGPEAVAAMIEDLTHYQPASWPWLADHFRSQLPADPAPVITCGTCRHGLSSDQHPAITHCAAGAASGLPIGGRWHTDRHHCPEFIDRATGRKPAPITTTRDTTPTTTRDPFNPFD